MQVALTLRHWQHHVTAQCWRSSVNPGCYNSVVTKYSRAIRVTRWTAL